MDLTFTIKRSEIPFPHAQANLVAVAWNNAIIVLRWLGSGVQRYHVYLHIAGQRFQKKTYGAIPQKCRSGPVCSCSKLQQPHVFNDKMFVLANWGCEVDGGVLHILDLKTWTWKRVTPKGAPPLRKSFFMTSWLYMEKLYFFGGMTRAEQPENKDMDDYPSYIKMHRWRMLGQYPYLNSGSNINYYVNQLFCYNIENNSWEWPNVKGKIPSPRTGHLVIINDDKVFLAGGHGRKPYRDLHTLDMKTFEWKRIHGTIENGPLDRHDNSPLHPNQSDYTLTLISGSSAMLFGSTRSSHIPQWEDVYDDCWILHLNRALNNEKPASIWTRFRNHLPRREHAAVLEPVTQRLWIIGGLDGCQSTSDVIQMTMNIVPLKILCLNHVFDHIRDDDERLQLDHFPAQVKTEMSAHMKRRGEVLYCKQGKGCNICHVNAMTETDLQRRAFHAQLVALIDGFWQPAQPQN